MDKKHKVRAVPDANGNIVFVSKDDEFPRERMSLMDALGLISIGIVCGAGVVLLCARAL
tara:strand:+ start:438948 stop:439124 length:177 start_codon:yes stop_codon:yes gene_type:complete